MQRYPAAVKSFIAENVKGKSAKELAELVNASFETDFTESKMKTFKSNYKLTSETHRGNPVGTSTLLSPEKQLFARGNSLGRTTKELTELINSTFGTTYAASQIKAYRTNHGLHSGLNFQFPKGHVPPNKGKKGYHAPGSEKGWYQKNHMPGNHAPIGTEVIHGDGYLWVKIAEPNKWKQKHRILWEEAKGKIPRDHCLLFGDGNRSNITLENLILISRSQLAVINRLDLIQTEKALTETGIVLANIHMKMHQLKQSKDKNMRPKTQEVHREQRSTN